MAFPSVESSASSNRTAAETTSPVSYPATVSAGATLICVGRVAVGTADFGFPGGWTMPMSNAADASDDRTCWAWKKADGTEDGTTFNVTHTSAKAAFIVHSITGAEDPTVTTPEHNAGAGPAFGTSATPDPNATTPVNGAGGAQDYLWIWSGGWEGEQTSPPASTPTNYTSAVGADSGTASAVATNCRVATAVRQLNGTTENPPSWTISVSDDWTAWTIAVHPVGDVAPPAADNPFPFFGGGYYPTEG